jgi:hypothetical protein
MRRYRYINHYLKYTNYFYGRGSLPIIHDGIHIMWTVSSFVNMGGHIIIWTLKMLTSFFPFRLPILNYLKLLPKECITEIWMTVPKFYQTIPLSCFLLLLSVMTAVSRQQSRLTKAHQFRSLPSLCEVSTLI